MKTASFITIHVGLNFGSKLQTIATSEILKRFGFNTICINYVPPRVTNKRYWENALTSPVRLLRKIIFFPLRYMATRNFDNYLAKFCKLSTPIYAESNFINLCPKTDLYVSGSDQLWNYEHNEGIDRHYFFDGIEGNKIAYASSIGMTSLPDGYAKYIKEQLSKYRAVSVREHSAVDLLENINVKAQQVLDPTFMLSKEDWKKFASRRLVKEDYIFVYLPYNIKDKVLVYRSVRKIANEKRLKVVTYSDYMFRESLADRTVYFVNPGDILSLILHANVVVTNSFHGTAFSINLNKQFWTYMPSHFSTRITSILDLCGLGNRLLNVDISDKQINEVIDYNYTNEVLDQERQKTIDFLTKALQ